MIFTCFRIALQFNFGLNALLFHTFHEERQAQQWEAVVLQGLWTVKPSRFAIFPQAAFKVPS